VALEVGRIKVVTQGWVGGPGLSQLHFVPTTGVVLVVGDCNAAAAAVTAFYANLVAYYPSGWTAQVQPVVQIFEASTGALLREQAITPVSVVSGSGSGSWGPTATGAVAVWHTSAVINGRLLKGRTFLNPLIASSYNSSGRLSGTVQTGIQSSGAVLAALSTPIMAVWHRPFPNAAAANGAVGHMSGCTVPDAESMLRSRRD